MDLIEALKRGEVAVVPTDTLYGLVGSVFSLEAVEKIFDLKKRDRSKPMIVLISSQKELEKFGIHLDSEEENFLKKIWPGSVSVALSVLPGQWDFLHRQTGNIAFRVPATETLREFLKKTGPLVAPSANWEGYPPAETLGEARKYFTDQIFGYVSAGRLFGNPSTLISLNNRDIQLLREGAVPFEKILKIKTVG